MCCPARAATSPEAREPKMQHHHGSVESSNRESVRQWHKVTSSHTRVRKHDFDGCCNDGWHFADPHTCRLLLVRLLGNILLE